MQLKTITMYNHKYAEIRAYEISRHDMTITQYPKPFLEIRFHLFFCGLHCKTLGLKITSSLSP